MTPHRLAAAGALVLLAAGTGPAVANAPDTLTVRGSRSAYVDVAFPARFRLLTDSFEKTPPQVSAAGSYAGVYVTRIGDPASAAGTIVLPRLPAWKGQALALGTDGWLPAGTYRVHLLADGASTVRLRAEGLRRDLTLAPEKRSTVVARTVRRQTSGTDLPADRTVIPVAVRTTSLIVLASSQESDGAGSNQRVCLRTPGRPDPCETGGGTGFGFTAFGAPGRMGAGVALVIQPGLTPAGETEAEYTDLSAGVPAGMYAFALTLG